MPTDWDDKEFVAKALLGLYDRQTMGEQAARVTAESNAVGFNMLDAGFCSSVAQWILGEKPFTDPQFYSIRKTIRKYKRQIDDLNFDTIYLPESALKTNGRTAAVKKVGDGELSLVEKNGKLWLAFEPYIYPSKHITKAWRCHWSKPYWLGEFQPEYVTQIQELFPQADITNNLCNALEALKSIPLDIENIKTDPDIFDFQIEPTHFLIQHDKAMLALAPGLGKTFCSILASCHIEVQNILVICPTSLMLNWKKEIGQWLEEPDIEIWHRSVGRKANWVIANYETVVRKMTTKDKRHKGYGGDKRYKAWKIADKKYKFDLVIVDESVLVKNRRAQRTQAIKAVAKEAKKVWLLSGSPTTKHYDDLWAQLNILDRKRFPSYWKFAEEYCHIEVTHWGVNITSNKLDAARRFQENYHNLYYAKTQDQVLDLPPWIFENVHIPMSSHQTELYQEMEQEFITTLPEGDVVLAPNILAQMTRLIQLASHIRLLPSIASDSSELKINLARDAAKWEAVFNLLTFVELPVILWVNYLYTANHMTAALINKKYKVGKLTSETSTVERNSIVEAFQANQLDLIVAHPGVGKFGLTLTAARTAIYLERSYNGDDYFQSLHRVRRIGTKESPHIIHLLAETADEHSTIDAVINKVLDYKTQSAKKLTTDLIRSILSNGE